MNTVDYQAQVLALAQKLRGVGSVDSLARALAAQTLRPAMMKGQSAETMQLQGHGLVRQVEKLEPVFVDRREDRRKTRKYREANNRLRTAAMVDE
jgi:hypothetical protein